MLVVNTILLISTICSATNIIISTDASVSPVMSSKLKRGIVTDPETDIRNNQEQFRGVQSTPKISSPQDINSKSSLHYRKAKVSDTQRVSHANPNQRSGSHAYGSVPKWQFSYASSPIQQTESRQNSPLAPYFNLLNNPSTYKVATSADQPPDTSKSIVSQSLQKVQQAYFPSYNAFRSNKPIELSSFANLEYPSYSSISKIISQDFQNGISSPTMQTPVYKSSPLPKAVEYAPIYAPSFPTMSSATSLFESPNKAMLASKQNDEATVDVNGKKVSVPIIQLQSDPGFSSAFPVFESQPLLLNANYPTESEFEFNFGDVPKANIVFQSQNVSPFSSPLSSFQGHVVPIQTASPQFPQYKGASIEVYSVPNVVPKVQGSYESLYNQPLLHFGKEHVGQLVNTQQNVVPSSISTEDILDDVEIINKKNPEPHPDHGDDDDEEEKDMRYKNPEEENEHKFEVDDVENEPGKYFKEPTTESDFKPSTYFPFKEYDETFGKYTKQTDDEDYADKPYSGYKNSSSDDDAEEEDPSSEYHAEYAESPKSHGSYEEEDEKEEESRKYEKRGETDENSHEIKPKRTRYYEKDFEREFEESYRKEIPKHRYVHVKEVPEIDSYNNPTSSRRQPENNGQARVNHERLEEPRTQESRIPHKILKTGYRDNAAHGTDTSAKKATKVVYEESYGYKNPKTGKYLKRAKTESAVEKYSPAKKSTAHKEDSYLRAAKYYKFKSPKTRDGLASRNKYPHSYSSASNWKLSKISTAVSEPNKRQLANPGDRAPLYRSSAVNGQMRPLTNAEILRDLTGI
ncbi:uncharacterized protein LOC116841217 [Odontomachus brunneus]|uniref:uncharacterized protein LOC116841217 n=1 Tax=Odontomachus brunneus TaxID=486640 RepID=UPI0013F20FF4|nr:uncharacterized protein LOC116841217 [Odontomachus brunneus]